MVRSHDLLPVVSPYHIPLELYSKYVDTVEIRKAIDYVKHTPSSDLGHVLIDVCRSIRRTHVVYAFRGRGARKNVQYSTMCRPPPRGKIHRQAFL